MAAYVIVDLSITDPAGFQPYADAMKPLVERSGGQVVAFDPAPTALEGDWAPQAVVVYRFPSRAHVNAFWASPDYQPLKDLRRRHATAKVVVIDA